MFGGGLGITPLMPVRWTEGALKARECNSRVAKQLYSSKKIVIEKPINPLTQATGWGRFFQMLRSALGIPMRMITPPPLRI